VKHFKNCFQSICFVFIVLFAVGCTKTFFTGFDPQSHFEYPNSNVVPLGKAVGKASVTKFMAYPFKTAELEEEAINNALQQSGGDILINYMVFEERTVFLVFQTLTLRVEGTAAKMEVGTQKLY
jgi:hypothetical protein